VQRPGAAQSRTPAVVEPPVEQPADPQVVPPIDPPVDPPVDPPAHTAPRPFAPPAPPQEEDSTRRMIAVATVVSWLAALVLMTAAVLWLVNREGSPPNDEPGSDRADVVTRVPEAPVPLPGDGAYIQLSVLPGDVLAVQQWLHNSSGFFRLSVAAPGGQVRVESFQVFVDGVLVEQRATVGGRESDVDLSGATAVYLQYRLSGALERTRPPAGRALARVTSLDLSYDAQPGPTTIAFQGAEVLTLACQATGSSAPPVPCGVVDGDAWRVRPPPGLVDYQVMAQLDIEPGGV
jgi:hypothetical protein